MKASASRDSTYAVLFYLLINQYVASANQVEASANRWKAFSSQVHAFATQIEAFTAQYEVFTIQFIGVNRSVLCLHFAKPFMHRAGSVKT